MTQKLTLHPSQPIELDAHGVPRFRRNAIVRRLLDEGPFDMNVISGWFPSAADYWQFLQLIGYSVSGYGELQEDGASDPRLPEYDARARELTE